VLETQLHEKLAACGIKVNRRRAAAKPAA